MFQLTAEETEALPLQIATSEAQPLRSQIATLKTGRGRRRNYRPYAFTEHGAVMLASVLNSPGAVAASVEIVRAFVRLRESLAAHKDLARRLDELEQRYYKEFSVVFDAIRQRMTPPDPARPEIGYHTLVPKP
jgi:hypothetical protein